MNGRFDVGHEGIANTTAFELDLGTGGWHVAVWNLDRPNWSDPGPGHIMKLRYTPMQLDAGSAEEHQPDLPIDLEGRPVVAALLHSQIAAITVAIKHLRPHTRIGYVMTDEAALPLALSDLVADLAARAARGMGLDELQVSTLTRAALLHDIGRPGISVRVWDKPGPLTDAERERVRMHSYWGERILSRSTSLADAAAIASLAHERSDGSGYHRGLPNPSLPVAGLILAVADAYAAMTDDRAHRPALVADQATAAIMHRVNEGVSDRGARDAAITPAGHHERRDTPRPGNLTEREVDVLRLAARGLTNKEIGVKLGIATKTVGHHLQHVYEKVAVTTRSAATLFAIKNDLL